MSIWLLIPIFTAGFLAAWAVTCAAFWVVARKTIAKIHGHAPWSWWVLAGYEPYVAHLYRQQNETRIGKLRNA